MHDDPTEVGSSRYCHDSMGLAKGINQHRQKKKFRTLKGVAAHAFVAYRFIQLRNVGSRLSMLGVRSRL